MNRHGRILIVDDEGQWREELVETLQHGGFYADSASSTDQALEQLDKSIYHVMILDIRMIHAEQSNIDGIKLLRELDRNGQNEATKVIILSAFGTQEQMRMAFTKYKVADFLSKNDFNNQEFLENVRLVFSEKVNINLALQIHWQRGSGSEIVLNLLVDGNRVKPGSSLQMQMVAELEDLLCRLFYHSESILVRPLIAGQSGMGVLRIKPFFPTGGGHEVIVKFGEIKRLEEEFRNFKEYVQPFLGGMRNTTVLDLRRTMHLGGIMYSLLGTTNDQLVDFGDFYRHSDLQKVKNAINQLFRDTCG